MGTLADVSENGILDHVFENAAFSVAAPIELALWVGDPIDDGSGGVEAAYTNYARQTIAFDAAAARLLNQTNLITFPQCGATGQAGITHYVIFDSTATPKVLATGSLSSTLSVVNGNTPSIAAGQCDVSLGAGQMSDYLANTILNYIFRAAAYAQPSIYIALCEAILVASDTTLVGKEVPNTNNYSRVTVAAWAAAVLGTTDNDLEILFSTPSGKWGTGDVVSMAICDSPTHNGGNMLFFDNSIVDQPIELNNVVKFIAGAVDITLT